MAGIAEIDAWIWARVGNTGRHPTRNSQADRSITTPTRTACCWPDIGNTPMDLGVKNYPRNIYPRIGIAYRLNDKTVIRAGFGMSSFYRYTTNWQYPGEAGAATGRAELVCRGGIHGRLVFPLLLPFVIPSNGIITNAPNQNFAITPTEHSGTVRGDLEFRHPAFVAG